MRYLLVSAAAVMAITGSAAIATAQMQDKGPGQDKSPGAERTAPPSGGAQRSPDAGEKAQQPSNRSEQKSESRKGAEREPGRDQPRNTQKNEPQRDKSATQPQRDNDKQKSTEQRKGDNDKQKSADQRKDDNDKQRSADQRKGDKDQQKSTDQRQRDKDQQRSTDQRKGDKDQQRSTDQRKGDKDQQRSTDQRKGDKDQQRSTDQRQRDDKDQQKSTKGPDQKREGRVQVTEEKRSGVRDRLGKEGRRVDRVDRTRINVSINVGARIPRSVRLHTLPVTIVSFAPEYRGYSYIVLEDETICIVDSNTYVIVDVIPAGSQRADRPGRTHLTLSADDTRFIYRSVPKGRTANVRVRLALGAEVPRDVELLAFPDEIMERVPDMRRYRYIVTENDLVIVDPDDYAVALVINE